MNMLFLKAPILVVLFTGLFVSTSAYAVEPVCFVVRNDAPYTVMGSFTTAYYLNEKGTKARHRSDFQLYASGSYDVAGHPSDRAEFCTYGPFLLGNKLELSLRTIFPVFQCNTRVDRGEIVITGVRKPDGGTETKATCF